MIEDLVIKVFNDRSAAHLFHWASDSYSEHMALGSFYDDIIEQIDTIVEVYQGKFGKIKVKFVLEPFAADAIKQLKGTVEWLVENKDKIEHGCGAVANELDSLEGIYRQTIYKLENLA